jgi:hypothetical protein
LYHDPLFLEVILILAEGSQFLKISSKTKVLYIAAMWCSSFSFISQSGPEFVEVLGKMPFSQILRGFFESVRGFDWPPLYFILLLNVYSSIPDSQFFGGYDATICIISSIFFWVENVISELIRRSDIVVPVAASADIEKALSVIEDTIMGIFSKYSSREQEVVVAVSRHIISVLELYAKESISIYSLDVYYQYNTKRNGYCIYQITVHLLRMLSHCIYLKPSLCPDIGILLKCRIGPEAARYAHCCIINAFSSHVFCRDEATGGNVMFGSSGRGGTIADLSVLFCVSSRDVALCESALENLRKVASLSTKRAKGNYSETLVDHISFREQAAFSIGMH